MAKQWVHNVYSTRRISYRMYKDAHKAGKIHITTNTRVPDVTTYTYSPNLYW